MKIILLSLLVGFWFYPFTIDSKIQDCESFLSIDIETFWTSEGDSFSLNPGYAMSDLEEFIKTDCLTNSNLEEVIKVLGTPTYKIISRTDYTSTSLFYSLDTNPMYARGPMTLHGLNITYNHKNNQKITWYMNPYCYD